MRYFVWSLVVAGVFQSGCSRLNPFQRSCEISGEVFIVTRGHESVKLGLVQVAAFRKEEVGVTLQRTTEKIKDEQQRLGDLYEQASALNNEVDCQHRRITEARSDFHDKSASVFASISGRSSSLGTAASMLRSNVEYRQKYLNSGAPFFESLPNSIAAAKTDADGKFRVKVPLTGKLVLGASTDRRVVDSVEHYYWLVNVDAHDGAFVTLSNDNLASSRSSESVIHVTESGASPISDEIETLESELASIQGKFKEIENDFAAAQRNLAQFTPTPEPVTVSPAKASAQPTQPPLPQTITLMQPVSVRIPYGSVILQRGTKLPVIGRNGSNVRIRYMEVEQLIPISATDIRQ